MEQGNLSLAIKNLIENGNEGAGIPCGIKTLITNLSAEDKQSLLYLVEETKIAIPAILKLLANNGIKLSDGSARKHRRKECRCFK